MKICVVGAGYVGLVTGAGLAHTGNDVVCADIDRARIGRLAEGIAPIYEPGLEDLIREGLREKRLTFTPDPAEAVRAAEVIFVAVGTPSRGDGGADLSAVFAVADTVAAHAGRECLLVLKSTVPVGTNERVRRIVASAEHPVHVVSNPEFLKEGDAVNDFLRPDRIVIGCDRDDAFARSRMARLYRPLNLDRDRILWAEPASAEMTKYVANAMLAMRISFMNEVATLCERVGADVHEVRAGVGSDVRIGPKFLYAGPGYGGSCFPKDVRALIDTGREQGIELEMASATHRVNERHRGLLLRKLKRWFDGELRGRRIGVWGIAFKPRTDDVRESPALSLIDGLLAEGAEVAAHDPAAREAAEPLLGNRVVLVEDAYDAAHQADALVLVTEWSQYKSPNFDRLGRIMRRRLLLDGRNVWSTFDLRGQGFEYEGIGVRVR